MIDRYRAIYKAGELDASSGSSPCRETLRELKKRGYRLGLVHEQVHRFGAAVA
ncbi:MAG: HAD family hydrolase [Bacillus subtilis]|nr:HAD family hydrolase [Bacillus subtilis]